MPTRSEQVTVGSTDCSPVLLCRAHEIRRASTPPNPCRWPLKRVKMGPPLLAAAADRCCSRPRRLAYERKRGREWRPMASVSVAAGLLSPSSTTQTTAPRRSATALEYSSRRIRRWLHGRAPGAAIARVEREVGHLWSDSMTADDRAMSQWLAEVSHALHRAARLLAQTTRSASRPPQRARLLSREDWPRRRSGAHDREHLRSDRPRIAPRTALRIATCLGLDRNEATRWSAVGTRCQRHVARAQGESNRPRPHRTTRQNDV